MGCVVAVIAAGPGVDIDDPIRCDNQVASVANAIGENVAQKPAGNFSPLSSCGQDAPADGGASGVPCADAEEAFTYQPPKSAIATHNGLYRPERSIGQPPKHVDAQSPRAKDEILAEPKNNKRYPRTYVADITVEILAIGVGFD